MRYTRWFTYGFRWVMYYGTSPVVLGIVLGILTLLYVIG